MLAQLSRSQKFLASCLILIGVCLIILFGWRTIRAFRHMREGPHETDVTLIRGWMTIPYISRLYHVPPDYIFERLGLSEEINRHKSLNDISQLYPTPESNPLINQVQAIILQFQADHDRPEPPQPPPAPRRTPYP
jgi:hypothetical protein